MLRCGAFALRLSEAALFESIAMDVTTRLLRFSTANIPGTAALSWMPSLLLSDFVGLMLQLSTEGFVKCFTLESFWRGCRWKMVEVSFGIVDLGRDGRCANWYREQAPSSQLGPQSPDEFRSSTFLHISCRASFLPGILLSKIFVPAATVHRKC